MAFRLRIEGEATHEAKNLAFFHTATVAGFAIEGHVPSDDAACGRSRACRPGMPIA